MANLDVLKFRAEIANAIQVRLLHFAEGEVLPTLAQAELNALTTVLRALDRSVSDVDRPISSTNTSRRSRAMERVEKYIVTTSIGRYIDQLDRETLNNFLSAIVNAVLASA